MLTGQRVERAGQQNKAASARADWQQKGCQEAIGATSEAGVGYYFSGCMSIHRTCYNSASKREKALTFPSELKRRNINLAHRNKGKCWILTSRLTGFLLY